MNQMAENPAQCAYAEYRNGHLYRCRNQAHNLVDVCGEVHPMCNPHRSTLAMKNRKIARYRSAADKLEAQQGQTLEAIHKACGS